MHVFLLIELITLARSYAMNWIQGRGIERERGRERGSRWGGASHLCTSAVIGADKFLHMYLLYDTVLSQTQPLKHTISFVRAFTELNHSHSHDCARGKVGTCLTVKQKTLFQTVINISLAEYILSQ